MLTEQVQYLPLTPDGVTPPRIMTIAGSDSGGGAGIQADLRTAALCGVHATVAVTAVTVQNSLGVKGFHPIPAEIVAAQMRHVAGDIGVQAAKTGMLASAAIIEAVADAATELGFGAGGSVPLLIDPVCASMHGDPLLPPDALTTLISRLFPLATIVTPNLDEVRLITGIDVIDAGTQRAAAQALLDQGAQWALVKGGHMRTSPTSVDLLTDGNTSIELSADRIATRDDHGGGDTLGMAAVCALAQGYSVPDAVSFGKQWVTRSLRAAYPLGAGHGPVSPLWRLAEPDHV